MFGLVFFIYIYCNPYTKRILPDRWIPESLEGIIISLWALKPEPFVSTRKNIPSQYIGDSSNPPMFPFWETVLQIRVELGFVNFEIFRKKISKFF